MINMFKFAFLIMLSCIFCVGYFSSQAIAAKVDDSNEIIDITQTYGVKAGPVRKKTIDNNDVKETPKLLNFPCIHEGPKLKVNEDISKLEDQKRLLENQYRENVITKEVYKRKMKKVIFDISKTKTKMFFEPVWAADSKSIYFQDMTNLYQIDLNGQILSKIPLTQIIGKDGFNSSASVFVPSPVDNNIIAFTTDVYDNPELEEYYGEPISAMFLYDKTTKTSKKISPNDYLCMNLVWSKDGKNIYFSGYKGITDEPYPFKLYKMNLKTNKITEITKGDSISI